MLTVIGVVIALPVLALLVGMHRQRKREELEKPLPERWLKAHSYDKDGDVW